MNLIWITKAIYLKEYQIEFEFNNSKKGIVDFKNKLNYKIFEPLKDINEFKKFKLNAWTIEWENGADFAPEFLLSHVE